MPLLGHRAHQDVSGPRTGEQFVAIVGSLLPGHGFTLGCRQGMKEVVHDAGRLGGGAPLGVPGRTDRGSTAHGRPWAQKRCS